MYYLSFEFEVYFCKGYDIVVNYLTQIANGLFIRRVLVVGVFDYIISSFFFGIVFLSYFRFIRVESIRILFLGFRIIRIDVFLVNFFYKFLLIEGSVICVLEENIGNRYFEILNFEYNFLIDEKKFLFFRYICIWFIYY